MTTETPIDFAEDGRLLADLGDEFADGIASDMVVECGYLPSAADAVKAMLQHAAAYREVVRAAKELCRRADERAAVPLGQKKPPVSRTIEARERLDAALARFRNITEGQS
jgi:hypothetical protein